MRERGGPFTPNAIQRAQLEAEIVRYGRAKALAALQLPDPAARALAEQHLKAELEQIYQNTFPDPATYQRNAAAYVERALARMHSEARRPRIDMDATESRLAIAQAMKSAGAKLDLNPPMPAIGQMSNAEYRRWYKDSFGHEAGV